MLSNWGYDRLAHKVYEESIGEMKHAAALIERILMLDGHPNLQDLGKLKIGEDVPEQLSADIVSEANNQGCLKTAITIREDAKDFVTREILESILEDTEEHFDWIETQQHRIAQTGLQDYLQEHMYKGDDS